MINDTINNNVCECIFCHYKWSGNEATNFRTDEIAVICPECGKQMGVVQTVEYLCFDLSDMEMVYDVIDYDKIGFEDYKCCDMCQNGIQTLDSTLGYCVKCNIDDELRDIYSICENFHF